MIKSKHTIAAAAGVFIVAPCTSRTSALLEDDEVFAVVSLEQINSSTQARNACANDHNGSLCVISVANRHLWP